MLEEGWFEVREKREVGWGVFGKEKEEGEGVWERKVGWLRVRGRCVSVLGWVESGRGGKEEGEGVGKEGEVGVGEKRERKRVGEERRRVWG